MWTLVQHLVKLVLRDDMFVKLCECGVSGYFEIEEMYYPVLSLHWRLQNKNKQWGYDAQLFGSNILHLQNENNSCLAKYLQIRLNFFLPFKICV